MRVNPVFVKSIVINKKQNDQNDHKKTVNPVETRNVKSVVNLYSGLDQLKYKYNDPFRYSRNVY